MPPPGNPVDDEEIAFVVRIRCRPAIATTILMAALCVIAAAQPESPAPSASRQSLQDAWWTGPLLANSAATLPRGHFLVEPYVYDIMMAHTHVVGSRASVLYGLVDRLTLGMIPIVAYNQVQGGPGSSGIRVGDVTLAAQYRLTPFREHH